MLWFDLNMNCSCSHHNINWGWGGKLRLEDWPVGSSPGLPLALQHSWETWRWEQKRSKWCGVIARQNGRQKNWRKMESRGKGSWRKERWEDGEWWRESGEEQDRLEEWACWRLWVVGRREKQEWNFGGGTIIVMVSTLFHPHPRHVSSAPEMVGVFWNSLQAKQFGQ